MVVYFLFLMLIVQISCSSICDRVACVCWYKNLENQDFVGDHVQCSYSEPDILDNNYTLPDIVHALDLSSNNITTVQSSSLLKSNTLAELFLNNNIITEVSADSFQLPGLKILDLSNNQLEFIDKETFRGLKQLEHLNLANNRFTTFTKLTFHYLSSLNEIILDHNNLGPSLENMNLFDRSGYGLTSKIQSISVRGINLRTVSDNFFVDAYDLRKLIISNNKINKIFDIPITLEYLDVSDNPISHIFSEDFSNLIALKVMKLNNVHIKEVSEFAFEYLASLKTLELERNKYLTKFSKFAFGREVLADPGVFALERLSLKGSRLSSLDKALSTAFGQLIELDLQDNPWQCNSNITWIKDLQISEQYYDNIRCTTPSALFNARIFDLDSKYFIDEEQNIGVTIAIVLCAILGTVASWMLLCRPQRPNFCRNTYSPSKVYKQSILPLVTGVFKIDRYNRL